MLFFGFGNLGNLILSSLLMINAIAVLSEDRFLARIGWSSGRAEPGFGGAHDATSVKAKLVNGISAVRTVTRIPLIPVNCAVIIYLLVFG